MSINMKTLTQALAKTAAVIEKTVQTTVQEVTGPKALQDYDLLDQIGSAGPGLAWKLYSAKARDGTRPHQYSTVCVWLLDKKVLSEARARAELSKVAEDSFLDLIRADAAKLVRLRHPGVVHVVQALDENKNAMAMVTEPLFASVANTLGNVENITKVPKDLQGMEMSLLEVKHGLLQIAETLDFLHNNAHLIHCAISPENVLVTSHGAWKLGGFGFSISKDQASSDSANVPAFHFAEYDTEDSVIPLQPSLNYTAPELVRSKTFSVGCFSDIFSFGCLAYHLIARKPLFDCHNNVKMVLPPLCAELRNLVMQLTILPMVLMIADSQDKRDFELVTLPALLPVLSTAAGETLLLLVKHAELIMNKTSSEHLVSHVLPMLVRAYDDNDPRIQEGVLRKSVLLGRQLDTQLVKQVILPRVHGLALKTTVAAVRVSALLCLGEFVPTLDKKAVLDVLQTIQSCTAVDHSAPTLMCTLGVSNSILKQYGVEFAAEHVLPLLIPLLTAQQLNVQQFAKYMLFVKDILRKIEEKRGVTLTDSGIPEVKRATIANGLQSQALGKANGTVVSAKSRPSWDEDWVPTTGAAANASDTAYQPSKNDLSVHSILGDKSIQSAPRQPQSSLISTVPTQQTSISCPAVDIEWPPRPFSGVNVESSDGDKQLNAGTSLPSKFEDLDPFANWPPRSSTSSNDSGTFSNGSMGSSMNNYGFSSISSTTNNQTDNSNNWMFGNQNSGDIPGPKHLSSSSNADILNSGDPKNSLGFMKQNQRVSASMNSSYNNQKPADIGSIFGSSKIEQTAPRLAPPPSTAVGRGRGRSTSSASKTTTYAESTSEQPPLLDLL